MYTMTEDLRENMSSARRKFLDTMNEGVVTLSAVQLAACGGDQTDTGEPAEITAIWNSVAAQLEADGFHAQWDLAERTGHEASHIPQARVTGREITVWVEHEMTERHFTNCIYIKDQDGLVIGMTHLLGQDDPAEITFTMPVTTKKVTPYSSCALHGLWVGEGIDVP